jgi:LacI family transcriptional regulator
MVKKKLRPTLDDVARLAGVSTATVSRVINNTGQIADGTRDRVQAAIEDLNYKPYEAARSLASGRLNTIGLITPVIARPFFSPMLRGIEATARDCDYKLLIHCTQGEPSHSTRYERPLGPNNTDGLLIFADVLDESEIVFLHESQFPIVLLHQTPPNSLNIPVVSYENKESARKLIEHLIQVHGYRRIAFIKGRESQEDGYWRELGYRKALQENGITFDPNLLARGSDADEAEKSVGQWLSEGVDIDAIFAVDDDKAMAVMHALIMAGKKIPEDIAVVGFDDSHVPYYPMTPLTTVRAPIEDAGREAVNQLMKLIKEGHADQLTLLPTELVIRRTCGCG